MWRPRSKSYKNARIKSQLDTIRGHAKQIYVNKLQSTVQSSSFLLEESTAAVKVFVLSEETPNVSVQVTKSLHSSMKISSRIHPRQGEFSFTEKWKKKLGAFTLNFHLFYLSTLITQTISVILCLIFYLPALKNSFLKR